MLSQIEYREDCLAFIYNVETMPVTDKGGLAAFGYAQELFRSLGGFSNFAISFSIISILTGAVTLYGYGFAMGGPLEMSLGWPIATLATLTIAVSMGELCSAYPTSGAMYHWTAALGAPRLAWFVAWFNVFGLIAALAGINYSCAQFVLPFLGWEPAPARLFVVFAFITLNQGALNHFGVRLVAILNDVSVAVHIAGVVIIAGAVFYFAPLQPVSFLGQASTSSGHSPYWWAFLLGLLQAHWTFTGFDGSAHMAEETGDPRRRAPWGIVLSVAVSGVVGYLLLLALTLAIQDPAVLRQSSTPAPVAILQAALWPRAGTALGALASMAMWFCGLAALASTSRTIYSLARDEGTPLAHLLKRVDRRHGTPGWAIWTAVFAALVAMVWTEAVPVVTSLSTVALYIAYAVPIALGLRARRADGWDWTQLAVWRLGAAGRYVNAFAVLYTAGICVVLMAPPNLLAAKTAALLLVMLLILWFLRARHYFRGPAWSLHPLPEQP